MEAVVYRGLFEAHTGGADTGGSDSGDDAGAEDALVVSSSRLLDAKTARLRELRARYGTVFCALAQIQTPCACHRSHLEQSF